MIFYSYANNTNFDEKGFALCLTLKVRFLGLGSRLFCVLTTGSEFELILNFKI